MKKLPIGINDYKQIIEGNYIYVDKTRYLHEMATTGIYYFLSRPRRFGKSLTVSTFYYLFTGQKELFKDTWIYNNWDWEKERYPVVVLDMNKIDSTDLETLREYSDDVIRLLQGVRYRISDQNDIEQDTGIDKKHSLKDIKACSFTDRRI